MFAEHYERLVVLDEEIKTQDQRISGLCQANELSKRYKEVLGVGSLIATAVLFDIGDGKGYARSSDYADSLGLVPRQYSSGDKQLYLGISKRGNRYIRTLLIHRARAVLSHCDKKQDKLSLWLQALIERRRFNRAAVALANKNARILWADDKWNKIRYIIGITRIQRRVIHALPREFIKNRKADRVRKRADSFIRSPEVEKPSFRDRIYGCNLDLC